MSANKLRSALTMLGIIFGVAAVIAMMSIGEGAKQETLQQIELLGTNNIIIKKVTLTEASGETKASFSPGLTLSDAKAIKEINPFISLITPIREMNANVTYRSTILQTRIVGTTPEYLETFNSKLTYGSFIKSFQINDRANVCVIGSGVKEKLFKFENPLGKKIKIEDSWFNIIGVIGAKSISPNASSGLGVHNFNEDVYIPITTMMYKMEKVEVAVPQFSQRRGMVFSTQEDIVKVVDRNSLDQLTLKVNDTKNLREAAYLASRILERRHFGVKDYQIILPEELLEQKQRTQRIFNVVMGAIAGISLLVGGIGIMNIMLANILERTREIGVRRAVGATRFDILSQFLFEAITISLIGGILGILVGFILTSLISTYAQWKTIVSTFAVIISFFVSLATGLLFGIYPAKKAADKNPIESLRYE
ncbi:MAG: ABC transporter permease [Ignavibacteria bacterium]|nr:ABC transporter permease [Ignavibacteria bacterium]